MDSAPVPKSDAGSHGLFATDLRSIARRLARNVGLILSTSLLAQLLALATLALNARAVGVAGLGVIALMQAMVAIVGRICAFDTWQPIVKLGSDHLARGEWNAVVATIKLGVIYDLVAATVAGLIGMVVIAFASIHIGIPLEYRTTCVIAGIISLFLMPGGETGAAAGVLRLFDRFGVSSAVRLGAAVAIFGLSAALYVVDGSLHIYLIGFALINCLANIALAAFAIHVARAQTPAHSHAAGPAHDLTAGDKSSFRSFAVSTSIYASFNMARVQLLTILAGAMLNASAVGVLSIATRLAAIINKLGAPAHQAIAPEIARLIAQNRLGDLRTLLLRTFLLGVAVAAASIALLFASFDQVIRPFVGSDVPIDIWIVLIVWCANCLYVVMFFATPTVQMLYSPSLPVMVVVGSFLVQIPTSILLIHNFGVGGAAAGQFIFMVAWAVSCGFLISRKLWNR